jgi:hypothetical protein
VCLATVLVLSACSATPGERGDHRPDWHPAPVVDGAPLRAFTATSWWNTPVPPDAPSNRSEAAVLRYMSTEPQAGDGCVRLAGAEGGSWGQPVYWAQPGDPEYDVTTTRQQNAPPELRGLRIPRGARPAENNDASMTIFDVARGYAVAVTEASFDADTNHWSVSGATVTYLDSNGLDVRTGRSSDERNSGSHRGNNPAVMMVRLDELEAGAIDHVLKVASGPEASTRHVFPMVGSDGDSTDPAAPPQGLRFRIKPSVNLEALRLAPEALVIARALQEYGFYIGDSGGSTSLKLEDAEVEGRGERLSLSRDALCGLPLTRQYWDVLPEGYQPPPSA